MARIVSEVRPRFVFVENSSLLIKRGAALVIGDLAEMGYDSQWCIVSASDCGAPHKRDRFWLVANPISERGRSRDAEREDAEDARQRPKDQRDNEGRVGIWDTEPNVGRVANGVARRVDRLKAIGNGQVPIVAATAFQILTERTL